MKEDTLRREIKELKTTIKSLEISNDTYDRDNERLGKKIIKITDILSLASAGYSDQEKIRKINEVIEYYD